MSFSMENRAKKLSTLPTEYTTSVINAACQFAARIVNTACQCAAHIDLETLKITIGFEKGWR